MRVIVVGAGVTGLTTAALLARAGHSVEVWEALSEVGGVARAINWGGHRFAPGPQYMWGLGEEGDAWPILSALGIDLPVRTMAQDFERLAVGEDGFRPVTIGAPDFDDLPHAERSAAEKMQSVLTALGRAGRVIGRGARFRLNGRQMMQAVLLSDMSLEDKAWVARLRGASVADLARRFDVSPRALRRMTHTQSIFAEALEDLSALVFAAARHHLLVPPQIPHGGFDTLVTSLTQAAQRHGANIRTGRRVTQATQKGPRTTLRYVDGGDHSNDTVQCRGGVREGQVAADHVVWACSPGVVEKLVHTSAPEVAHNIRERFTKSHLIQSAIISFRASDAAYAQMSERNYSWFADADDVHFAETERRVSGVPRALNFTSPTLNARASGPQHVLCTFGPAKAQSDAVVRQTVDLLRRDGIDIDVVATQTLCPATWTAKLGAFEGSLYGRRLTSRSLRQSVTAGLPTGWSMAHSGVGIPGLLGCLQTGHSTAAEVLESPLIAEVA